MADPTSGGLGGNTPNPDVENLLSRFQDIQKELTKGATGGKEAYREAIEDIRRQLELYLLPAFRKLSSMDLVKPSAIAEVMRQFKEQEKTATRYHQIVGTLEEKQAAKTRDSLSRQIIDVEKHYNELRRIRQAAVTDEEEKGAIAEDIERDTRKTISGLQVQSRKESMEAAKGVLGGIGSTLLGLGGIGSIGALVQMMSGVATQQYTLGSVVNRMSGTSESGADTIRTGATAGRRALGGLTNIGLGGMDAEAQAKALGIVYSRAPQLAGQKLEPIFTRLINMGQTGAESAALVGQASAESGVSIQGMVDNLELSRKISAKFGQDTLVSMYRIMDFTKAIRTTGVDSKAATEQAQSWTALIQDVGSRMHLGQDELANFATKFQSAISSMSPSHAAGLMLATTGRMPTSLGDLSKIGTPEGLKGVYDMVSRGLGKQGQMFAPQAFGSLVGMGNVDIQTAKLIQEAMGGGSKAMAKLQDIVAKGDSSNIRNASDKLTIMEGPISSIANVMKQIIAVLMPQMAANIQFLAHPMEATSYNEGDIAMMGAKNPYLEFSTRVAISEQAVDKRKPVGKGA